MPNSRLRPQRPLPLAVPCSWWLNPWKLRLPITMFKQLSHSYLNRNLSKSPTKFRKNATERRMFALVASKLAELALRFAALLCVSMCLLYSILLFRTETSRNPSSTTPIITVSPECAYKMFDPCSKYQTGILDSQSSALRVPKSRNIANVTIFQPCLRVYWVWGSFRMFNYLKR